LHCDLIVLLKFHYLSSSIYLVKIKDGNNAGF
jgi:hypothetical protein